MGTNLRRRGAALMILSALAIAGCSSSVAADASPSSGPSLKDAAVGCGMSGYTEYLDDGATLKLDAVAQDQDSPVQLSNVECLLDALGAPQAIASKIGETRALDGRQSDDWDGYEIEWSYHPDDGANIIIQRVE